MKTIKDVIDYFKIEENRSKLIDLSGTFFKIYLYESGGVYMCCGMHLCEGWFHIDQKLDSINKPVINILLDSIREDKIENFLL